MGEGNSSPVYWMMKAIAIEIYKSMLEKVAELGATSGNKIAPVSPIIKTIKAPKLGKSLTSSPTYTKVNVGTPNVASGITERQGMINPPRV